MPRIEIIRLVMLPIAFAAFMVAAQLSAGFQLRTSTPRTVVANAR
jgi:hypothetical protein